MEADAWRICPKDIGTGTGQQGESAPVFVPRAQALVLPSQKVNLNWKISKIASEIVFDIMDQAIRDREFGAS